MKFVIDAAAAKNVNESLFEELLPVMRACGVGASDIKGIKRNMTHMEEVTHLKHVSVHLVNGEWVFWIDDELMFKHIKLIGKVARFIAPIVMSFKLFLHDFKPEVQAVERWIKEEK